MSWLARSIANTLRLDDDDDEGDGDGDGDNNEDDSDCDNVDLRDGDVCNPRYGAVDHASSSLLHPSESYDLEEVDLEDRIDVINGNSDNNRDSESNDDYCNNQGRGVREDLSEFRETLTRQFWGVASLLAPPPPPPPLPPPPFPGRNARWLGLDRERRDGLEDGSFEKEEEDARDEQFEEIQRDFVEMGAAMEEDEEEVDLVGEAVGITEEVLAFAQNIAHHPETWLDFPLSEEEDFDDFEISDTQLKHARAVESLAPRLAALRRELCPAHLSDGYFWMVYFVLLHSRLNKHDADLLSTPQLVKARVMWVQELQKQTKEDNGWLGLDTYHPKEKFYFPQADTDGTSCEGTTPRYVSHVAYSLEPLTTPVQSDCEIEKHPIECSEVEFIDKTVIEEDLVNKRGKDLVIGPSYKVPVQDFDEDNDDWLADDSELVGYMGNVSTIVNEEDVSFSDLEDDADFSLPLKSKTVTKDWSESTTKAS